MGKENTTLVRLHKDQLETAYATQKPKHLHPPLRIPQLHRLRIRRDVARRF